MLGSTVTDRSLIAYDMTKEKDINKKPYNPRIPKVGL